MQIKKTWKNEGQKRKKKVMNGRKDGKFIEIEEKEGK